MPKGKKICPSCGEEHNLRIKVCDNCSFNFTEATRIKKEEEERIRVVKREKREEKERVKFAEMKEKEAKREAKRQEKEEAKRIKREERESKKGKEEERVVDFGFTIPPLPAESVKMTKKEHAKRILSYGVERATNLLSLAKNNKYWPHVDWEIVERKLK
jgi:hypothetical protein